ncbi:hypothetical protein [Neorhizobium sp. T6_25]|uniref:hypothetical protein n=1 Tax=Neorhizobium sp. T6_25 TaxID=2093833 RepID=UPI000CF9CB75|nr:hypothetical protein [Neorhizobium sp. T6_25]
MQVTNIIVAKTTDSSITVEFKGEGNDLITVRLSADPNLSEEDVVQVALTMVEGMSQFRKAELE